MASPDIFISCELLDKARLVVGERKLNCKESCKKSRRCPFIHEKKFSQVFPPKPPEHDLHEFDASNATLLPPFTATT